jgi:hypothetical protein
VTSVRAFLCLLGGLGFGLSMGSTYGVWLGTAYGVAFSVVFSLGKIIYIYIISYPFLQIWDFYFYKLEQLRNSRDNTSLLRYNSAFWDQWQRLPLYGLDKHLLLVIERNPVEGAAAINYLETSFQKWVIQIARDALSLRNCSDVETIRKVHQNIEIIDEVENSTNPILSVFLNTSQDVDAALNQKSSFNQRLALKSVAKALNGQLEDFNRSTNKYASSFKPFAQRWLEIIQK